ncbi:MAG: glycosyltransferase family A protein [Dermatophilaceae bacterium]
MTAPHQAEPSVTVVIPTRDRPQLVRRAIRSALVQDYLGTVDVVVVYDGVEPEPGLLADFPERVRVLVNRRTPGLAGARNTGILDSTAELIAFLDDDDWWRPTKLRLQVAARAGAGRPALVTAAMTVDFDGRLSDRLAGTGRVGVGHLLRSRMAMLHSSSFLFDRGALFRLGLVDESAPGSQNEDWDLLLRVAKEGDIVHVDEPLVVVRWGRTSFFARRWDGRNASLGWMLDRHPEIAADRVGRSRVYGQLAFGEAAQGHRAQALGHARTALRSRPAQWRAWIAIPVAVYPPSSEWVMNVLHRHGRGV